MTLAYLVFAVMFLAVGVIGLIVEGDRGYLWMLAFSGVCWFGALIEANQRSRVP